MSDFCASLVLLNMLDWPLVLLDVCVHLRWRSRRRTSASLKIFETSLELLSCAFVSYWHEADKAELLTVVSLGNAVLDSSSLS